LKIRNRGKFEIYYTKNINGLILNETLIE